MHGNKHYVIHFLSFSEFYNFLNPVSILFILTKSFMSCIELKYNTLHICTIFVSVIRYLQ